MLSKPISSSLTRASRRASDRFKALTALALVLGVCTSAHAQNAMLVLPDVCDDPAGVFDYQWVKEKFGTGGLFVMQAGGGIDRIQTDVHDRGFADYQSLYVAAHGSKSNTIGGMSHAKFVQHFKAAHALAPDNVEFAVCYAARAPDSLLKQMNTAYGDKIDRLSGGVVGCALTGNGDRSLENADYRIYAEHSDPARYDKIIDNITAKWSGNYPGRAVSYKNYCKSQLVPFSAAGMKGFFDTVYQQFSTSQGLPKDSTNYLELVALNEKGQPLTVCGANPDGDGKSVPCP